MVVVGVVVVRVVEVRVVERVRVVVSDGGE